MPRSREKSALDEVVRKGFSESVMLEPSDVESHVDV